MFASVVGNVCDVICILRRHCRSSYQAVLQIEPCLCISSERSMCVSRHLFGKLACAMSNGRMIV